MTDRQEFHPIFGISRMGGSTDTCSKCGHTIPEEHVPLILWSDDGNVMWVFCATCDDKVAPHLGMGAA